MSAVENVKAANHGHTVLFAFIVIQLVLSIYWAFFEREEVFSSIVYIGSLIITSGFMSRGCAIFMFGLGLVAAFMGMAAL